MMGVGLVYGGLLVMVLGMKGLMVADAAQPWPTRRPERTHVWLALILGLVALAAGLGMAIVGAWLLTV